MAKLTLTSDEGEVLEIWNVTSNAGRDGGVYTDGDFNVSVSFARTQLVDEIRQEVEKHESRTYGCTCGEAYGKRPSGADKCHYCSEGSK